MRSSKGKGGRRPPVKVKSGSDVPLMPVVVGGILLVLLLGMIVYVLYNNRPATPPPTAGGVPCDKLEQTKIHYHAALQIMYQGGITPIPSGIGIQGGESAPTCFYWLHVHASSPNVIHIESPADRTFTLGQFFDVWNTWSKASGGPAEPLDATHVSTFALTPNQTLVAYVDDGSGPKLYSDDPRNIVLKNHEVITLEITPPEVNPPPSFSFTSGL